MYIELNDKEKEILLDSIECYRYNVWCLDRNTKLEKDINKLKEKIESEDKWNNLKVCLAHMIDMYNYLLLTCPNGHVKVYNSFLNDLHRLELIVECNDKEEE